MPAFFSFGVLKNDQVTNGGSFGVGQNMIQNRTATKQNIGALQVGDGIIAANYGLYMNADPDGQDQFNLDTNNIAAPQA